jgi:hypothetical protein
MTQGFKSKLLKSDGVKEIFTLSVKRLVKGCYNANDYTHT